MWATSNSTSSAPPFCSHIFWTSDGQFSSPNISTIAATVMTNWRANVPTQFPDEDDRESPQHGV